MRRRELLLGGALAPVLGHRPAWGDALRSGWEWPQIQLLDGPRLDPESWHGVAAVLVFWATNCPYCKRHNAHIDKLHRATRGRPLRVLGAALDTDARAVRQYMATNGYAFAVTLDGAGLRQGRGLKRVIPLTCLIDPQGRLLQAIPGEMFEEDVLVLADELLSPRR
ncbi:alkyl hydroperoxide reductase [Paucibacter sp. KBW04]|uniref:TlpA disulfide reductase family protein n=1 Tax=Paucibacter sp. KBW04 TaxID=2153361 RepID=UPI000F588B8C|nr:TlpA disulfide reductase family protein [Paucibacter sp. KBW04]RQO54716.1 alkyl hydroperoxide reductase [Paucibacter sp. KBW04]